ncbi:hypothetical protein F6U93_08415 [Tamlana haliotis]|uniref:Uncharacterized protein n=1 Tax=Pseudotamlana haliotis TaxID=2614804 RepID=A0A6N6MG90_9FLAO|nr:hypothetical protein [Tamlana haliotis]KAB1067955.1 hypothetical protein F6U93_08415 [Tamlana haliotis]
MTREERLLDFIVFTFCDYELLNDIIDFFYQEKNIIEDYKDFLDENIEEIPEILTSKINYNDDFQSFDEFLDKDEQRLIIEYFSDNYNHYYDGGMPLDISAEDFGNYFEKYLQFKKINSGVYISFFVQFYNSVESLMKSELTNELSHIENTFLQYNRLSLDLSDNFKKLKQKEYEHSLFESINKNHFQVQGFIDNFEKQEFFLDSKETIIHLLETLPVGDYNHCLGGLKFDVKQNLSQLPLEYLNYTYFGVKTENSIEERHKNEELKKELEDLKKKHTLLVTNLDTKGFCDAEINILFNLLQNNKFSKLNIRSNDFSQAVSQFHILYLFFVFDFYEGELDRIKDFKKFISDFTLFKTENAEQYRKYYSNLDSKNRHYPFNSVKKTSDIIESKLNISREKLKKIPKIKNTNIMY